MAKNTVGSIRKVVLDGVTYNAAGDADLSMVLGKYTNEAIVGSGGSMKRMTLRNEEVSGVDLLTNGPEHQSIVKLSERTEDFPISFTTAAGDTYYAPKGFIDLEKRQTGDGKTTIKLIPSQGWTSKFA